MKNQHLKIVSFPDAIIDSLTCVTTSQLFVNSMNDWLPRYYLDPLSTLAKNSVVVYASVNIVVAGKLTCDDDAKGFGVGCMQLAGEAIFL